IRADLVTGVQTCALPIWVFAASLFARSLCSDLQLMAALSEREARLQSYFDLSLVGAAILSPDGRCGEVNDELCRMFGYARPELRSEERRVGRACRRWGVA